MPAQAIDRGDTKGHTRSPNFDVHTNTYTGAFSIKSMKRVIDRLDYPGVEFYPYQMPDDGLKKRMRKGVDDMVSNLLTN